MDFEDLKSYLLHRMKMSHIYQPVMIKAIVESNEPVAAKTIAQRFLEMDQSQIEYYEVITKQMPGVVLKNNGVVSRTPDGYILRLNEPLTVDQRSELVRICEQKIADYIDKRGKRIWQHRELDRAVPGSLRYEVLKRAGSRCENCGISNKLRSLEADHILPRNKGGKTILDNLQALCWKCNSEKRDTDSTDLRVWNELYDKRERGCFFCEPDKKRVLVIEELVYVLQDGFPVTEGHTLIIPMRHVESMFDLTGAEINACHRLINRQMKTLRAKDKTIKGFNVGVNVGEEAGQTVMHCHWHLIPRRKGDVDNPRGGIRNLIPGKGDY